MDAAKRRGGVMGALMKIPAGARAGLAFASLYLIPVKTDHVIEEDSRMVPSY
jgi:magnesium-protoporphyrin IX monomethyl ester (oxidative) cyclase